MRWHFKNGSIVSVQEVRRGRFGKGQCHANAGWLARRWPERYEWWTGYARIPKFGGFDNHSWVRVVDGPHVEVTYDTPSLLIWLSVARSGASQPTGPLWNTWAAWKHHVARLRPAASSR